MQPDFEAFAERHGRRLHLEIEPGTYLVARAGVILASVIDVAEEIIGLPVRLGIPQGVGGLVDEVKNPQYSTGVGLVHYGAQQSDHRLFRARDENIYSKVKNRMAKEKVRVQGVANPE